jgi:hypothetical protein
MKGVSFLFCRWTVMMTTYLTVSLILQYRTRRPFRTCGKLGVCRFTSFRFIFPSRSTSCVNS